MSEYLRSALDGIWAHKLRSMLTMLGIIIGIASIIAISSTIMGTNEQIKQNLIGAGNNTVTIKLYQGDYEMQLEYEQVPEGVPILDASILKEIREISEVEDAALFYKRSAWQAVYHGETGLSQGTILGVDENYIKSKGYTLAKGRNIQYMDITDNKQICVIGDYINRTAYGGNAAMMHYHATPENHAALEKKGFLLVDSGATYMDGTTDITRTYPLGPLTEDEKRFYTWTLQSHIDLAKAVWLDYCECKMIDTIAREPLWRHLINYRCGTGHSVSFVGNVHEGPHSLRGTNSVLMRPGMVVTDEPGVYETDLVGIRIENELVCVHKADNQYGTFLGFEPLTFVPIATSPILPGVLDKDELAWLNDYHRQVFAKLAPHLNDEERSWLAGKCAAIGC